MSQSFFFVVASKIGDFANRFLNTVLQCCPTIFGRFAHPEAHFLCHFLEFGRGVGNLFEKKQNKSCYFQNVFNFLATDFSLAAGIFYFFRQFSVCFQVFHTPPLCGISCCAARCWWSAAGIRMRPPTRRSAWHRNTTVLSQPWTV